MKNCGVEIPDADNGRVFLSVNRETLPVRACSSPGEILYNRFYPQGERKPREGVWFAVLVPDPMSS